MISSVNQYQLLITDLLLCCLQEQHLQNLTHSLSFIINVCVVLIMDDSGLLLHSINPNNSATAVLLRPQNIALK